MEFLGSGSTRVFMKRQAIFVQPSPMGPPVGQIDIEPACRRRRSRDAEQARPLNRQVAAGARRAQGFLADPAPVFTLSAVEG
jgi:hypothetical protein